MEQSSQLKYTKVLLPPEGKPSILTKAPPAPQRFISIGKAHNSIPGVFSFPQLELKNGFVKMLGPLQVLHIEFKPANGIVFHRVYPFAKTTAAIPVELGSVSLINNPQSLQGQVTVHIFDGS